MNREGHPKQNKVTIAKVKKKKNYMGEEKSKYSHMCIHANEIF